MKAIVEEPWDYTLFEMDDGSQVLTFMSGGAIEVALSMTLNDVERRTTADNPESLKGFVIGVRRNLSSYKDRIFTPAVWYDDR